MMKFSAPLLLTATLVAAAVSTAAPEAPKAKAKPVPAQTPLVLTDVNGKRHEPFQSKDTKAVVVIFVSTDCPIANSYQPTLATLATKFSAQGVAFFQVHCDPDVTAEVIRKHARDFKVTSPVVRDDKQALVRRLDAKITPEAFVLTSDGATAYRGRIDNLYETWGKKRPKPSRRDLELALTALLAGKPLDTTQTEAVGCRIFVE